MKWGWEMAMQFSLKLFSIIWLRYISFALSYDYLFIKIKLVGIEDYNN